MNHSGRPSRWRPSVRPVRLIKSDGQFSSPSSSKPIDKQSRTTRSGFTAGTCIAAGSLERPNIRSMNCNQSCPAGYGSYGYDGTEWNYGSACTMYNMICVKNDYDKNSLDVVAGCCNEKIPQKDCDPTLCRGTQSCRDKMLGICDSSAFNTPACQTWLTAPENDDMFQLITPKYCTAEMFASGTCRNYALNPKSHGQMDREVTRWCTPGQIVAPPKYDPKLTDIARFRFAGGPTPTWLKVGIFGTWDPVKSVAMYQQWSSALDQVIAQGGKDEVLNPKTRYLDNSQDKICACIASPLNKLGSAVAPPSCFDTACQAGGYRTGAQKDVSLRCPSYTDCRANVAAVAGGTNQQVNIQQICGTAPLPGVTTNAGAIIPSGTTTPVLGQKDDKQLLQDDEARVAAAKLANPPILGVTATPGLADQLNKPFMPGQFGDMSIASAGILFFALIILSAILWRQWANQQSQNFAQQLQAEQIQAAQNLQATTSPAAMSVRTAIQAQISNLPPVGAVANVR